MSNWTIRVGHGWRDSMPQEARTILGEHVGADAQDGRLGVLCTQAHEHVSPLPLFKGDRWLFSGAHGLQGSRHAFMALAAFLTQLERQDADMVSLTFLNLLPQQGEGPRPAPADLAPATLLDGLRLFAEVVSCSILPGEDAAGWSLCEWAMLVASRQVGS